VCRWLQSLVVHSAGGATEQLEVPALVSRFVAFPLQVDAGCMYSDGTGSEMRSAKLHTLGNPRHRVQLCYLSMHDADFLVCRRKTVCHGKALRQTTAPLSDASVFQALNNARHSRAQESDQSLSREQLDAATIPAAQYELQACTAETYIRRAPLSRFSDLNGRAPILLDGGQ
jgi:hypothetical protein